MQGGEGFWIISHSLGPGMWEHKQVSFLCVFLLQRSMGVQEGKGGVSRAYLNSIKNWVTPGRDLENKTPQKENSSDTYATAWAPSFESKKHHGLLKSTLKPVVILKTLPVFSLCNKGLSRVKKKKNILMLGVMRQLGYQPCGCTTAALWSWEASPQLQVKTKASRAFTQPSAKT